MANYNSNCGYYDDYIGYYTNTNVYQQDYCMQPEYEYNKHEYEWVFTQNYIQLTHSERQMHTSIMSSSSALREIFINWGTTNCRRPFNVALEFKFFIALRKSYEILL